RARHDRHRRALAADRPPAAGPARARDDRALGPGEGRCMTGAVVAAPRPLAVSPWLRLWGAYLRWSTRNAALASLVPFIPVVALWAAVARSGVFPPAFFPGPLEVIQKFGTLMANGILPAYLEDS